MPNVRRYHIPDTSVFITQVVAYRTPIFCRTENVELLRATLHRTKDNHPFAMLGYVFLPDHLHLLIKPEADANFSSIMQALKRNFTLNYRRLHQMPQGTHVWQRSFWDHVIRDDEDFARHLDYIHYNPVRHGLAEKPEAWPHSSFLAWKARGVYEDRWGWDEMPPGLGDDDWE